MREEIGGLGESTGKEKNEEMEREFFKKLRRGHSSILLLSCKIFLMVVMTYEQETKCVFIECIIRIYLSSVIDVMKMSDNALFCCLKCT